MTRWQLKLGTCCVFVLGWYTTGGNNSRYYIQRWYAQVPVAALCRRLLFSKVKSQCPSLLAAVDRAVKLHFIFNIQYIHASEHVWQLLQKLIYRLHDTSSTFAWVTDVISYANSKRMRTDNGIEPTWKCGMILKSVRTFCNTFKFYRALLGRVQ